MSSSAARDRGRIISQQDAEEILLLPDAPFQIGDFRRGRVNQLLRLAHVEDRIDPVFLERLCQVQGFFSGGQRALRDFQFEIKFAQLKICRWPHSRRESRSLPGAPTRWPAIRLAPLPLRGDTSPEIEIPGRVRGHAAGSEFIRRNRAGCGIAQIRAGATPFTVGY